MLTTIIGALLPIVVVLPVGFFSGWHKDFTGYLGYVFGPANASIPATSASLAMNLVQVPVCLMLLSTAAARTGKVKALRPFLLSHVIAAVREPIVWAPVLAIILVITDVTPPKVVSQSMLLLGQATGGVALFASGIVLFSRRVSFNWIVALNAVARSVVVPAVFWGVLVALNLPPAEIREAAITLAIPTAAMAVIIAVQFRIAEQEMASSLLFSTAFSVPTMGAFMFLNHMSSRLLQSIIRRAHEYV